MLWNTLLTAFVLSLTSIASAHYTFPRLLVGGQNTGDWTYVRRTDNYQSNGPVTDVNSGSFRCYTSSTGSQTYSVAAGSQIGFQANQGVFHQGVLNVYMAKAPNTVAGWDGSGQVWFKIHEVPAVISGGQMSFPAFNVDKFTFNIPSNLPSGEYLVRVEHIALHSASSFGGAQFYISCAQVKVINGGSGTPGPLVSIPGVYNGREPGIMVNIYYPIPSVWQQPGPAVWRG